MLKKRLFTILSGLVIVAALFAVPGNAVFADSGMSSVDQILTIEDLIKMSDKELSEVPQTTLIQILNNLAASDEKVIQKYAEQDLQRLADQYLSNENFLILKDIAQNQPVQTRASSIDIGWSISVSWAEDGDGGESGWGAWGAEYNYSGTLTESQAWVAGLGGSSSWARTGHTFNMGGSGSGFYRIDMNCAWGCGSTNWGTNTLTLLFEEWRNGGYTQYEFPAIDSYSALAWSHEGVFNYSAPTYVQLYAGATYRISLKVTTQASTILSAAGADCMYGNYGAGWDYLHLQYLA